ncbi:hypothetical protein TNCV_2243341 [Trichonephila clavipes]|nr:hypothetical protein TNCV_2243341 [Trichonephila clavipes]
MLVKCIVPVWHEGTLNIRPAASLLVGLAQVPEVLPQKPGSTKPNSTVTCMVLKATAIDRRKKLTPCHDELHGP